MRQKGPATMSYLFAHPGAGATPAKAADPASEKHVDYYEELLHTIEQMQQDSDRRSVALAGAVHDLKTPLAVIGGFVNLLMGQKLGAVTDRQLEALKDIATSCRRLDDAIGKLLCHSANNAKKQSVNLEMADFNSCITQIRELWSPVFEQRGVRFVCKPPNDVMRFKFDRQCIQQVIANLLENALKFTPAGGTVSLSVSPEFWDRRSERNTVPVDRRISRSQRANAARIVVNDTGPGIAPQYQQEVFEEFFSLSLPGVMPGIGLGLTIARHLVQSHQGKIWVESRPGKGAKFCVLLPFVPQPVKK
jgi:two-component system phosphate regulon sensor histidine kinase PhoR